MYTHSLLTYDLLKVFRSGISKAKRPQSVQLLYDLKGFSCTPPGVKLHWLQVFTVTKDLYAFNY
jgi:hypothetical protein